MSGPGGPLSRLATRVAASAPWLRGTRVLAACSGGPDSIALLLVLEQIRREGLLELVVGHVHHGLREQDSDADQQRVTDLCLALDIPLVTRRVDALGAREERRRGLEEAARVVRRAALDELRHETDAQAIALAHSADDQAETVLLRLLRGVGPEGLRGMSAWSSPWARPFLGVRRDELRELLVEARVAWRSDSTNWGPSSARGLIRGLLERIEERFNENVVEQLARTSLLIGEDHAHLEELARQAAERLLVSAAKTGLTGTPAPARLAAGDDGLGALPPVLSRRIVRRVLRDARPDSPPPSLDAVERTLRLATPNSPRAREAHVARATVSRHGAELRIGAGTQARAPEDPVPLEVPGLTRWGALGHVEARLTSLEEAGGLTALTGSGVLDGARAWLDHDKIHGPLVLRARRSGDLFWPFGAQMPRGLSGWLKDRKVPREERSLLPLACRETDDVVAWVAGQGIRDEFRLDPGTQRILLLEWKPAEQRDKSS